MRSVIVPSFDSPTARRLLALCCGLLAVPLYLATLTQVHTFDALSYVTSVERKPWQALFHPHHLAYGPMGAALAWLSAALAPGSGAAVPLQIVNVIAGAAGIALFADLLMRLHVRPAVALAAAGILGGSYAFWYYAVEIEVYTLAALFLILGMRLLLAPEPWSARRAALLGAAHALAVLFHQTNVLFGVVIAVVALTHRDLPWRDWLRRWSGYAMVAGAGIALPYLFAGVVVSGFATPDALWAWLTEYARTGWWGGALLDGAKLVEFGRGIDMTIAAAGGAWLWLALAALACWGWLAGGRMGSVLAPCSAWLAGYGLFFFWWEPDNIEFWIASLPPLLLLWARATTGADAGRWSRMRAGLAAIVVVGIIGANGSAIAQRGDASRDLQRVIARALAEHSTPADLLLIPDGLLELYLPYYERRENFLSLNQALFDADSGWPGACAAIRTRVELALHAGATVIIADEVRDPPDDVLTRHRALVAGAPDACLAPYLTLLEPLALPAAVPQYAALRRADALASHGGWSFAAAPLGWTLAHARDAGHQQGWQFVPEVDPALLSPLLSLDAARVAAIEIRLRNQTRARDAQLFYADAAGTIAEERSVRWTLDPGDAPVTYRLGLGGAPGWTGRISRIRIDPVGQGDGGTVTIESVRLIMR
jgi:hypothetical protein